MAKYYKGKIILANELMKPSFLIYACEDINYSIYGYDWQHMVDCSSYSWHHIVDCSSFDFYQLFEKLDERDKEKLEYYFSTTNQKYKQALQEECYSILNKMFKYENFKNSKYNNNTQLQIIFEIFEDTENNLYGKEVITGTIFPLINKYKINITEDVVKDNSRIIQQYDRKVYLCENKNNIFVDCKGNHYKLKKTKICDPDEYELIKCDKTVNRYRDYQILHPRKTLLNVSYDIIFSNADKIDYYLENNGLANQQELEEYLQKYQITKKSLFNTSKREFKNKIINYSKCNCFKHKIDVTIKEKKMESQNKITIIMENIEYMLSELEELNVNLKNDYEKEYEEILKNENGGLNLKPFDINTFILLEAKIKLSIELLKRNSNNIMEYLNNIKKEYLENIFNNIIIQKEITIKEIDQMMESFLKSQNFYNVVDQRKILKSFSLVYLLIVLKNKDEIDSLDLMNSYFKYNLKTILMYLNLLIKNRLIKNNVVIELEEDLNLQSIINIIKKLNIYETENKDLILKL